ncbi:hypothetical protein AB0C34_17565 [Nocardia sp. NPDC049220]|uniref:hypothetical protein n=1 Tax=Nocardia sp. NPDC049220 TaxID=3155273 RepID=UPI0033D4678B
MAPGEYVIGDCAVPVGVLAVFRCGPGDLEGHASGRCEQSRAATGGNRSALTAPTPVHELDETKLWMFTLEDSRRHLRTLFMRIIDAHD